MLWKLELVVPERAREAFEAALSESLDSDAAIASIELREGIDWRLEAFIAQRPDQALLGRVLAAVAQVFALPPPELKLSEIPEQDWVADNQRSFQPFTVGRFYIYPSFHASKPPRDKIAIQIDPGMAFGTGTHATTQGCLLAIDRIAQRQPIERAIDVGCGSGILAIALAHLARRRVTASDNDPIAVRVTKENAALNNVAGRIIALRAEGFGHFEIAQRAPFQLIVANILAQPLIELAPKLSAALAPGGHVILSGLLARQEEMVAEAYRAEGISLYERIPGGDWVTLMLRG